MSTPGRFPERLVCPRCGTTIHWTLHRHDCNSAVTRTTSSWSRLRHKLVALLPGRHSGRCACPLCSYSERHARIKIDMPVRHPERITRGLPDEQEELLAVLADEMWPEDEYVAIITGDEDEHP